MGEKRYIISDASKMIDAESHVLRYWEDELEIEIPRNELGHRYYTDYHINLLKNVKQLKEQGFQLKAIKMLLSELPPGETVNPNSIMLIKDELNNRVGNLPKTTDPETKESKMEQFQLIISEIVSKALVENKGILSQDVSDKVTENVIKEIDYLVRIQEEKEEERFKKIDELIRNYQKGIKETALTADKIKPKKQSKFYKKYKRTI
jgi:DNA-binding transcriptional MerR regulator